MHRHSTNSAAGAAPDASPDPTAPQAPPIPPALDPADASGPLDPADASGPLDTAAAPAHRATHGRPARPARPDRSPHPTRSALSALATSLALPALQSALAPRARRAAARARGTRFRFERLTAGRAGGREALLPPPVHLSLRDSRTLNLALAAPEPDPRSAELLITRGHRRFRVPLAVERHTDDVPLLTATVTLRDALDATHTRRGTGPTRTPRSVQGPGPAGDPAPAPLPLLSDGVWRLTVVTTGADGRVRRRGFALAGDGGGAAPGPTTPHAPSPRTGTLMRVVRCRGGRAAVQVTRSPTRAELVRFVPRGDGITVYGRVVAGPREPGGTSRAGQTGQTRRTDRTDRTRWTRSTDRTRWTARAVRRRDGVVAPVGPAWDGPAFSFTLPFAAMADAGPGQWVWDFRVGELPLGRRLTDVRDLPSAFPTPFRVVALPDGRVVRAHPHFTASGTFAVTCLDITKETS